MGGDTALLLSVGKETPEEAAFGRRTQVVRGRPTAVIGASAGAVTAACPRGTRHAGLCADRCALCVEVAAASQTCYWQMWLE